MELTPAERAVFVAGRSLIGLLFLAGAVQKALDPTASQILLRISGLPEWLVWPALVFNALVAGALLSGVAMRPAALLAALYCMVTSWFHLMPDDPWQMSIFAKNWAIAGGCLSLAVLARPKGRWAT